MRGTTLRAWLGSVQAEDDYQIAAELAAALEYVMPFHIEVPVIFNDGQKRQVVIAGIPYKQPGSPDSLYRGFVFDVTAQRMALLEALRTAAEYRLLVENSTDLIAHCGTGGKYLSISPSYSRMIGWSAEELVDRPVLDFLHSDDRLPAGEALSPVLRGGLLPVVVEVRKRHREGHHVMLGTKACAVIDPTTGNCIGAVLVSRDITREKEKIKSLEKLATIDELTGLPNRAWIVARVSSMLAKREGRSARVLKTIKLE